MAVAVSRVRPPKRVYSKMPRPMRGSAASQSMTRKITVLFK